MKFDGASQFMAGGHQILHPTRRHKRKSPEWVKSDIEIRKLLLRSFPKMTTHPRQRRWAGRWARVIHLYFRLGHTPKEVSEEMEETEVVVRNLLNHIRRAARGVQAHGGHKRMSDPIRTSLGEQIKADPEPTSGRS